MKLIGYLLVSFALLCCNCPTFGQQVIALHHLGTPSFYANMNSAITSAQDGDTLYFPGGAFLITGNLTLTKRLHIIGAGHNPDSSLATGRTSFMNGNVILQNGASNGSLTGVYLSGNVQFGSNNSNVNVLSYSLTRCNFADLALSYCQDASCPTLNSANLIRENIIRGSVYGGSSLSNYFYNNIIAGEVAFFNDQTLFSNNIFLNASQNADTLVSVCNGALFENNVFLAENVVTTGSNANTFNTNLFTSAFVIPANSLGLGNATSVLQNAIFVTPPTGIFDYAQDYRLQTGSVGIGMGLIGATPTDVGVYGGLFPAKIGSMPFNPHIRVFSVPAYSNTSNQLDINITVTAQDN